MTESLNRIVIENIGVLAVVLVYIAIAGHLAARRIDKRIDAILLLLKKRGIDLLNGD